MHIDTSYVTRTLAELVRINSINPAFSNGRTNESAIAAHTSDVMGTLGMEVLAREPEPGRVSVVGRLRGRGGGRSLLLYAHYDTVGIEGMADPFSGAVHDGRLYGRGAYDMKCGLAACLGAVQAIRDAGRVLDGDLHVAAVADEEVASIGMSDLLTAVRADAAIVTEPTELAVCTAHKGFVWLEVDIQGRAAHGSRYDLGIDANMRMGRFLGRLDELEQSLRARAPHPKLGTPSLHAAVLQGGTGTSTYAAQSRLEIERRTLPDESPEGVLSEISAITDALAARDPSFQASVRTMLARPGFEIGDDRPIVQAIRRHARDVLGHAPADMGAWYWMDAALLAGAGIDTVVLGPAGEGAHAAVEWVDLDSVMKTAGILARTAVEFCGT
ncbi:MAG TPA: M20/M25/M40 family metallo-hydrolase [Gemmatimonadaceae bacterium]|nr:M20/M25/M40 family metallo-hydrolase [Gemmatimonadaceae bacterium]